MQNKYLLTERELRAFTAHLREEEYAAGSIELYLRDCHRLFAWLNGHPCDKAAVVAWKESLKKSGYAPVTVNAMLAAVNRLFRFLGWEDCRVKSLRIQRRLFRSEDRELTKEEYLRLVETAEGQKRVRLALLLETICATGIRVSEVKYITVEAAQERRTEISLKGKIRTILLPGKLCRKLLKYARGKKIASGEIFITESGKSLSRKQIWSELKSLCKRAGVESSKVFPHNLRHLFAKTFYRVCRDVAKLADILGHSSIETTRVYLISTGVEHIRDMTHLGLIT